MKNKKLTEKGEFSKNFITDTNKKLELGHAELCEEIDKIFDEEYYSIVVYLSYASRKEYAKNVRYNSKNSKMTLTEYFGDDLDEDTRIIASTIINDAIVSYLQQSMPVTDAVCFVSEDHVSEKVFSDLWFGTKAKNYGKAETALATIDFNKKTALEFFEISKYFGKWFRKYSGHSSNAEDSIAGDFSEFLYYYHLYTESV